SPAEAKKCRKRWLDFFKARCAKWEPSKRLVTCSKHFKPEDFARRMDSLLHLRNSSQSVEPREKAE
ncbi:hypothetical protein P5673_025725, partial [Acropora cervicornis]